jgi:raffinose/stachyose/melibiose transport system substrate-binding protein
MLFDGKAAMTVTGSWMLGTLLTKPELEMDFFILPPFNKNLPGRYTGGLGGGLAISAATKYPDECAKFLDFINFSEEGQRNFFEGGNRIPCVNADLSKFKINPLFKKVIEATKDPKGIGYNLSVVTPANVKNAYYEVIQGLIGGLITPADANQTIQKEAEKARAEGKR